MPDNPSAAESQVGESRGVFDRPFRVVTDDQRCYLIVEVDRTTAQRAANLLGEGESGQALGKVIADAVNLHAVPGLIRKAGL